MHVLIVFPFFINNVLNAEYVISSWPVTSNSTLMIPSNILCIWNWPSGENAGYNFVCSWQKWYACIITSVYVITFHIHMNNDWLLALSWQFLNRVNKCMDLRKNCPTSCFNHFSWNVINTRWLEPFSSSVAISTSKALVALLSAFQSA